MLFQAYVFQDTLRYLQYLGVWDVVLPFALIFAILYSVIKKTGVFTNENVNVVVALSISLLAVIPHVSGGYPPGLDIVLIINAFFPQIALVLISIVMVLMMTGLMADEKDSKFKGRLAKYAAFISIALVAFFMYNSINPLSTGTGTGLGYYFNFLNDPQLQAFVISALVFGLVVWGVTTGFSFGGGGDEEVIGGTEKDSFMYVPIPKKRKRY